MSIDFKNELNKNQFIAATSNAKHLRIIAGAGTGKTRTLTYRLAHLILRGDMFPSQIVAITFTNKVAKEMKERVNKIIEENNFSVSGMPLIATFHGFCYRFLVKEITRIDGYRKSFQIADETDQAEIFKHIAQKLKYEYRSVEFKGIIQLIHSLKTDGIEVKDFNENDVSASFNFTRVNDIYEEYQNELRKCNLIDFDDILIYTRRILLENPSVKRYYQSLFKCFLVDEFQDTNNLQYEIVKLFMNDDCELCVVGDPDQTIYTWRGANNHIIKEGLLYDFKDLQTVTLDMNYRSTQKILDKANMLIKHNRNRVDKALVSFNDEEGEDVEFMTSFSNNEEANKIGAKIQMLHRNYNLNYSDIAIIYRSNFLSRTFEHAFSMIGIPYRLYGSIKFYERLEIKIALSYLRVLINPEDNISFEKVLKNPSRKIGDKTLENLYLDANNRQETLLEYFVNNFEECKLSALQKNNLKGFLASYVKTIAFLNNADLSPKKILDAIKTYLEDSGFINFVDELDKKEQEEVDKYQNRMDNVNELFSAIIEYLSSGLSEDGEKLTLNDFLINVAMEAAQDTMQDADAVVVMTAHISKGLEFPCVFVAGMIDNVFPSFHAYDAGTYEAIEEERRLFYVAMTRAKKYLTISTYGGFRFDGQSNLPSKFLKEIGFEVKRNQIYGANQNSYSSKTSSLDSLRSQNSSWKESNSQLFNSIDKLAKDSGYAADEDYHDSFYKAKVLPKVMTISRANVSKPSEVETYKIGDKIAHASFGVGQVIAVDGNKIRVKFNDEVGVKLLMIGFKAFKKIN